MSAQQGSGPSSIAPGGDGKVTARGLASEVGSGIVDELVGTLMTWVLFAGIIIGFVVPIAGLVLGGLGLLFAFLRGRSKILPGAVVAMSIVGWVIGKSPLGMLPLILDLLA